MLHLLGLALFLGSVFGHILAGALGGAPGASPAYLAAREHIAAATHWLTLPGLALLVGSGLALWQRGPHALRRHRWLAGHLLSALLIVMLTLAVIVPAGERAAAAASQLAAPAALPAQVVALVEAARRAGLVESVAGALNLLLALGAVVLAAVRPRLG